MLLRRSGRSQKSAADASKIPIGCSGSSRVARGNPGESPYAFTGGTIRRVAVDVSGEPYLDPDRHAEMLLKSQ